MKFDLDYLEKIANMLEEKALAEIELHDGGQSIKMKKADGTVSAVSDKVTKDKTISEDKNSTEEDSKTQEKGRKSIVSPMVGTFYKSMSPEAQPFVEVGQTVAAGQVVCIIEAMKLMNEIEAEVSGRVIEICVEDGQPVEFGQVLMYLE